VRRHQQPHKTSLDQLAEGAAHALLAFAQTTSAVNGTDKASNSAKDEIEYQGPHANK
jgi:hypothetical protein